MGRAKNIIVKPIKGSKAREIVKHIHYSKKTVNNSCLHLGVFIDGKLEGAMQFGPPTDKRKLLPLVKGTLWNQMLELNRMAFSHVLPRNSESRAIGIAFRLIKKYRPDIKWVVSFSDATQCGDGIIYRASGFVLTGIKKSINLARLPDGSVIHKLTLHSSPLSPRKELNGKSLYDVTGGKYSFSLYCKAANATVLPGYQLRYIKFVDPEWVSRLQVPVISFKDIPNDAKMYKGKKCVNPIRGA